MKDEIKKQIEIYDIESVEITDKQIILNRKQPEFKAGDFVYVVSGDETPDCFAIYHSFNKGLFSFYAIMNCKNSHVIIESTLPYNFVIRHLVESEKNMLFDELRKQENLKWNAKTMKLEKIRWRAEKGDNYKFIGINRDEKKWTVDSRMDDYDNSDNALYEIGNYFNPDNKVDDVEAEKLCADLNALFTARL